MSIPGSLTPLFNSGSSAAAGVPVEIERSLRFNSADSAFLSRTPAVAGNRRTFTWAGWVKRAYLGSNNKALFSASASGTDYVDLRFESDGLRADFEASGQTRSQIITTAVFRDPSAWYHVVFAIDSTQGTAADRVKIYINGINQATSNTINQNIDFAVNNTVAHSVGRRVYGSDNYLDGCLAECYLIDGQALTPSSFTEVSATTGQLIPKAYTGSFGTNGFWLKFSDNSTAAALGTDTSGNGNTWTVNNIAPSDGTTYSNNISLSSGSYTSGREPAKGFDGLLTTACQGGTNGVSITLSSLVGLTVSTSVEFYSSFGTPGDNTFTINGSASATMAATNQWTSVSFTGTIASAVISSSAQNPTFSAIRIDGVILVDGAAGDSLVDTPTSFGTDTGVGNEVRGNYCTLNPLHSQGATFSNGNLQFATASIGKIFGTIAVSSGKWYWEAQNLSSNSLSSLVNGVGLISGNPNTYGGGDVGDYAWLTRSNTGSPSSAYNNGNILSGYGNVGVPQNAIVGTAFNADIGTLEFFVNGVSQGVAWNNIPVGGDKLYAPISGDPNSSTDTEGSINFGQRAFSYTAPSGYKCLVDTNIPVVVAKGSSAMDVKLYTGNAGDQTISGLSFSPDFIWTKSRSQAYSHNVYDSIRGTGKNLFANETSAENTDANTIKAFNSNGFQLGSNDNGNYTNGGSAVAWCWDAGTSTVSNTAGSITSQVRANVSAGFSIVKFTPSGAGQVTVGHGLGASPGFIIVKTTNLSANWYQWVTSLTVNEYLTFTTAAKATSANFWGTSLPSSTVFGYNAGGSFDHIAYCFSPVVGYSSFGSYTGNGSGSDGPFVYTGFRPRFLMVKQTGDTTNWFVLDTARNTYNAVNSYLMPNSSSAEDPNNSTVNTDFLSNGFKLRASTNALNASSGTYIYYAVAENPFQYSRAR